MGKLRIILSKSTRDLGQSTEVPVLGVVLKGGVKSEGGVGVSVTCYFAMSEGTEVKGSKSRA